MAQPSPPPAAVLDVLGQPGASLEPLDPRGQPWLLPSDAGPAVLRRSAASLGHVAWLHRFLARLAATGFPAPRPLPILDGASLALVEGAVWEAVAFLPGRPLGWDPAVPVGSAGALLARFHQASGAISPPDQRPQALPLEECRPVCEERLADRFQQELAAIGHQAAPRCVVHGDATAANMLVDEHAPAVSALIDFALAHLGTPESDISFALWVTGRTERLAVSLDADRVRAFVAGYHRVRPLTDWAVQAIPLYLVGRGLQLLVRLERAGIQDAALQQLQRSRLHWLADHRRWLEEIVALALVLERDARGRSG
jgi:Ser/Thr protein kinase RdoA (MazF antagonist)